MNYWLVKSEPDVFSYQDLVKKGGSMWDGVRNYQARNNLKAMNKGDLALFYHSNIGKEVVGICEVNKEYYPDPTAEGKHDWVVVDMIPYLQLQKAVTLAEIKSNDFLKEMPLVKHSRLSVMPLSKEVFEKIVELGS